ncbi:hypothetical protein [uncultured Gimesia sp.]|uniref:hypothetical protein n=1 Tax=uncultured Gimesia sp. TaxID=1678688 RepID=UPI00260F2672|nr:hypothetical protein [uncultured Gimesia sp.]
MEYQLIIQFPAESLDDFDALVRLEDRMIGAVGSAANIDGHDFGSGEANIFIITSDPKATFDLLRNQLELQGILDQCKVAHREISGEQYTVLWPADFKGVFMVL